MSDIEFIDHSEVELINCSASDDMVAMAAWVSNGFNNAESLSDRQRVKGLIKFLYRNNHNSPFEHGIFTFRVQTPIFVAREFMRHRTFSFNEMSGRYTQLKPQFYLPSHERPLVQEGKIGNYHFVPGTDDQYAIMLSAQREASTHAWNIYHQCLQNGVAREVARNILPLNIMTEFYASVDPRNLMGFLKLRTDAQALHEIRAVANAMEAHFAERMPLTYEAFKEYDGDV